MLNRFITRDNSFEKTIVQIVKNSLPAARIGKRLGEPLPSEHTEIGTIPTHELLESANGTGRRKIVWGISRFGGSHIVI